MNKTKFFSVVLLLALALGIFAPAVQAKSGPTIVDIAAGNPNFSTLVAAVVKANLAGTLSGNRMFTVFAPTNAAFDAAAVAVLGAGNDGMDLVEALDAATLRSILLYHVTPGRRLSNSIVNAQRIRTMSKGFLFVNGTTLVGNNSSAGLILTAIDIEASNGVIHAIDFVLLP